MHTHLAESPDENTYCDQHFGCTPLQYMESVGWVGDDVWFAHGIEFADDEIARLAATSTGVAHCPTSNARLATGSAAPASSSMPVYPSDSVSTARPPTSRRDCSRRRIKRC